MTDCEMLPGFAEAKARIEEHGYLADWITQNVDTSEPFAVFLSKGNRNYKSNCPHYEGYWLCGHIGSVKCAVHNELLPGLQHTIMCSKDFTMCKFYSEDSNEKS